MFQRLYTIFIEPRQTEDDRRSRELVLNVLLSGTLGVMILAFMLLLASFFVFGNEYVEARIGGVLLAIACTSTMFVLSRSGRHAVASWMLIILYALFATGSAYYWGVAMPVSLLLFCLVVVITGTLLGSPFPVIIAAGAVTCLLLLQVLEN